jgi:hypothetical protein
VAVRDVSSSRTTSKSSAAPMCGDAGGRNVRAMKRKLFFILVVTGLLVLALAGWTVQGLRWAASGGGGRTAPAPA